MSHLVPLLGWTHNIVGSILRDVAKEFDTETADQIIIDMKLEKLVGIPPRKSKDGR